MSATGRTSQAPDTSGGRENPPSEAEARWARIKDLFAAALEKSASSRAEFLAEACGDDVALRTEVETLLTADEQAGGLLDSGARLPESAYRLERGTRLGPYNILEPIGAGGMSQVYRARDTRLGREIAIKFLAVQGHREEAVHRFELEARAASALNHPNILAIHDVGSHEGSFFIVSELLRGQTLREALGQGRLPLRQVIDYALQLAEGMASAHEHGIVHRDLKPENLFVTESGRLKILDFGIAKLVPEPESAPLASPEVSTQAGTLLGTIGYMSPEQVRGEPADQRSDIFSFGAVLYEMLVGERAFGGDSALLTAHAIVHQEPSALPADAPGEIAAVVRRCLKKDRSERFQSAKDLISQLNAASRSMGAVRWTNRRAPLVALLVSIGLLTAAAGLVWSLGLRGAPPQRRTPAPGAPASIAVLPFVDLSPGKDQQYFSDGIAEEILNALGQLEGLRVPGRTSSFWFRDKPRKASEIARELKVAHLLDGTVRRDGNRVRISAELIDAGGYRVWSQTYDRELTGVFAMQDEISRAVVDALKVQLTLPRAEIARSRRTTNPEVYNEYLLGNQFYRRLTYDGNQQALAAYQRALTLDSSFAPAWAGLAMAKFQTAQRSESAEAMSDAYTQATAAAESAVALDPDLAEAYLARGYVRQARLDWQGARSDCERALALRPNDAQTRFHHASLLAALGRLPDAIAEAEKATELDPLWAGAWSFLGRLYYQSGQLGPARAVLERSLRINPEQNYAPLHLAIVSLLEKRPAEALSMARRSRAEVFRLPVEAVALHDLGHEDDARMKLEELIARYAHFAAYNIAEVYALFGERDRAFEWLDRARVNHEPGIGYIKMDFALRDLRRDPRFDEFLRKVNLPLD